MTDNAMAWNDNRNRVAVVGHAYSSRRARLAQTPCDLTIGSSFSIRDTQQLLPDCDLKRRAVKIQGEIESRTRSLKIFFDLLDEQTIRRRVDHPTLWNMLSKMDGSEPFFRG